MIVTKQQWVTLGYKLFAEKGAKALSIEGLSKKMGVSKSSFYHHFTEQSFFIEELMNMHLDQSRIISEKEKLAKTIYTDLITILIEHKTDLLFNRQLRFYFDKPLYKQTLEESNKIVGHEFIFLWLRDTQLPLTIPQASGLLSLALENFYLRINEQNFTKEWLTDYFSELKKIAQNFVV